MSTLIDDFNAALLKSKLFTRKPSNEELLNLYGLYKQATEGTAVRERPGGFDFKAMAKFDAWEINKGMDRDEAMRKYVAAVDALFTSYA